MSMTYLCTKFKNMTEFKSYVVMAIGSVIALLAPIKNFMYAMLLLFFLNFVFGYIAGKARGEDWQTKKAMKFIWYCCIFFVSTCCIFIIGYLMDEQQQAIAVVKILCYAAIYIFGTNIFRNWRQLLTPGTSWYKFADLVYYVLSVKFIERFKWLQELQKENEQKRQNNHHTILDKDDN